MSTALVEVYAHSARNLVATRYPQAIGAVLGGSSGRGTPMPTSDLDITVLLPDGATSRREVVRHEGRLAEVFLNTRADLRDAFAHSRGTRRATALFLFAESVIVYDPDGDAGILQAEAQDLVAAGPDPLTEAEHDALRFVLTDLLDDLTETSPCSDRYEQLAIADRVLREAAHLLTAHRPGLERSRQVASPTPARRRPGPRPAAAIRSPGRCRTGRFQAVGNRRIQGAGSVGRAPAGGVHPYPYR